MKKSHVIAIYVLVASVLLVVSVLALLVIQWTMQGTGSIKGVGLGVYWDPQCTNSTTLLKFGRLEPGSSKSFSLYLRNEGNSAITLNMTTENWNPTNAKDYMTFTWNREGQQVSPNEVIIFTIMLSVSSDAQGISSFSLDITISGTG